MFASKYILLSFEDFINFITHNFNEFATQCLYSKDSLSETLVLFIRIVTHVYSGSSLCELEKHIYKIDDNYIRLMNIFKKLHRLSGFFFKKVKYNIQNEKFHTRFNNWPICENNIVDYYLHKTIFAGDSYFEGSSNFDKNIFEATFLSKAQKIDYLNRLTAMHIKIPIGRSLLG